MIILSITGGALFSMDSKTIPFPYYSSDMDFQLRPNHFPHSLCDKLYNLGVTFHPTSPCLRLLSFFCLLSLVPFFNHSSPHHISVSFPSRILHGLILVQFSTFSTLETK